MQRFSALVVSGIVVASTWFVGTAFAARLDNIVTYLKMETIASGTVLDYSGQHDAVVVRNPTLIREVGSDCNF